MGNCFPCHQYLRNRPPGGPTTHIWKTFFITLHKHWFIRGFEKCDQKKVRKKIWKIPGRWRIARPDDPANFCANRIRTERDTLNFVLSRGERSQNWWDWSRLRSRLPFLAEACTFPFGKVRLPQCSHRRCSLFCPAIVGSNGRLGHSPFTGELLLYIYIIWDPSRVSGRGFLPSPPGWGVGVKIPFPLVLQVSTYLNIIYPYSTDIYKGGWLILGLFCTLFVRFLTPTLGGQNHNFRDCARLRRVIILPFWADI